MPDTLGLGTHVSSHFKIMYKMKHVMPHLTKPNSFIDNFSRLYTFTYE